MKNIWKKMNENQLSKLYSNKLLKLVLKLTLIIQHYNSSTFSSLFDAKNISIFFE